MRKQLTPRFSIGRSSYWINWLVLLTFAVGCNKVGIGADAGVYRLRHEINSGAIDTPGSILGVAASVLNPSCCVFNVEHMTPRIDWKKREKMNERLALSACMKFSSHATFWNVHWMNWQLPSVKVSGGCKFPLLETRGDRIEKLRPHKLSWLNFFWGWLHSIHLSHRKILSKYLTFVRKTDHFWQVFVSKTNDCLQIQTMMG